MQQITELLAAGGDIGIWVLVGIVWRFNDKLMSLQAKIDYHIEMHVRDERLGRFGAN